MIHVLITLRCMIALGSSFHSTQSEKNQNCGAEFSSKYFSIGSQLSFSWRRARTKTIDPCNLFAMILTKNKTRNISYTDNTISLARFQESEREIFTNLFSTLSSVVRKVSANLVTPAWGTSCFGLLNIFMKHRDQELEGTGTKCGLTRLGWVRV